MVIVYIIMVLLRVIGDVLYDHDTMECISDSFYGVLFVVLFHVGSFVCCWL